MTTTLTRGIAVPVIAAGILGAGLAATSTASATATPQPRVAAAQSAATAAAIRRQQIRVATIKRFGIYPLPVGYGAIVHFKLNRPLLRQVARAKQFAATPKARSVRRCESGGNYRINTGNGYYGAYQFDRGTWLSNGGGRYARYAHQAPAWAQDHIAYKTWLSRGWQPWACA